jgi:hypothetical protein
VTATNETLTIVAGDEPPAAGEGLDLLSRMHDTVELSGLLSAAGRRTGDVEVAGRHGLLRTRRKRYDRLEIPLVLWLRGLDADGRIPTDSSAAAEFYARVHEITAVLAAETVTVTHGLPDGSARWITGEVLSPLDPSRRNPGALGQLAFKLSCAYPFWTEAGDPVISTGSCTGEPAEWTLDEFAGITAPVEDAVIRFECTSGTVPNPSLAQGDVSLRYGAAFAVDDWVEIDCGTWDITAGGNLEPDMSAITKTGGEARFFVLSPPGAADAAPTLTLDHTGAGTLSVTLTGRRKFLVG